jgi:hypothetical protein
MYQIYDKNGNPVKRKNQDFEDALHNTMHAFPPSVNKIIISLAIIALLFAAFMDYYKL